MHLCRRSQRAGIASMPSRCASTCQRISIVKRPSGNRQAKAARHGALIGGEDTDPIGGSFELVICCFKRGPGPVRSSI
jgi:hypothetical protein